MTLVLTRIGFMVNTTKAEIHLSQLPGEILAIHLKGKWQLGQDVPFKKPY